MAEWTYSLAGGAELALGLPRNRQEAQYWRNPVLTRVSAGLDTLTFDVVRKSADLDPVAAFGTALELFRYGGGPRTRRFAGTRILTPCDASAESQRQSYTFGGPWYWLTTLLYHQAWQNCGTLGCVTSYTTHLILNINQSGLITVGQQIAAVISYAIAQGAPMQLGVVDVPIYSPARDDLDQYCSAVIANQLKYAPDAVTWFDYTTTPPTFHCRRRQDLTAVNFRTANYTANTTLRKVSSRSILPRPDLQVPAVVLHFEQINVTDKVARLNAVNDIWPATQPGGAATTGREARALVTTIPVAGSTKTTVEATIVCETIAPTSVAWWQARASKLADPRMKVSEIVIDAGSVARTGALNLPRELVEGQITQWMFQASGGALQYEREEVSAKISYVQYKDATHTGEPLRRVEGELFSVEVSATNAGVGETLWSDVATIDSADPIPLGAARYLYDALAPLQHEGDLLIKENQCAGGCGPGNKVNLLGARAEYATMAQPVRQTVEHLQRGHTTISFGPPAMLSVNQMMELYQANRVRRRYTNPALQATGDFGGSSGGRVQLGRLTPNRNTGTGGEPLQSLTLNYTGGNRILLDAIQRRFSITKEGAAEAIHGVCATDALLQCQAGVGRIAEQRINSADGGHAAQGAGGQYDLTTANLKGKSARWREEDWCSTDGRQRGKIMVACSDPYNIVNV